MRGHFIGQIREPTINQKSAEEFDRTVSSSRVEEQFRGTSYSSSEKAVPAQRRQFQLYFRSLASLAVWLDQKKNWSS
jgi:hypothetical protein